MKSGISFILLLLPFVSFAQVQATKYANEFLAIGVGGRAQGMGNTHVAIADDVTAGYWNPAGLLHQSNQYEVMLQHGEYFSGIAKYDYGAFSMKIDSSSGIGFSLIRFGIDDIPDTRFLYDANGAINYDNVTFFSAADYAFISSYARKLNILGGLKFGGNFKIVHRKAGDFASAWGFGLDVGAQLDYKKWQFGAVFRDVTGTFTAWSHNTDEIINVFTQTDNDIPQNSVEVTVPRLILGAARYFQLQEFGLLPTLDLTFTFDGERNTLIKSGFSSIDPTLGLEADYKKIAFLRFGLRNIQELKTFDSSTKLSIEPTFGIGFNYKSVTVDYALSSVGAHTEGLYSHIFSLKFNFDGNQ
ncbi:MAG: PorV/PorQ family protein [Bacteroidota bacterium]